MKYRNVCLESFGYVLPEKVVTSEEVENQLEPLYRRLHLPQGRLEFMTGIRQRRFWPAGTRPGDKSVESAEKAIQLAGLDRAEIGALVHGSVCRDFVEPATACGVHHRLGLSRHCLIYDVSNACLGLLNGVVQIANMIELGHIRAGLVVGTETGRQLVEHTIQRLNEDQGITRAQTKLAMASLTIGSASCAILLTDRRHSQTQNLLLAATAQANTDFHRLCHSGEGKVAVSDEQPWMETDSERLMQEGVATGVATFESFLAELTWTRDDIDRTFCHQVGVAHRRLLLEQLQLDPQRDYSTFPWLGNTGSAALPVTMALGWENGQLRRGPGGHARHRFGDQLPDACGSLAAGSTGEWQI